MADPLTLLKGIEGSTAALKETQAAPGQGVGQVFSDALKGALDQVDALQKESVTMQSAYAQGEPVDLHDVMIKIEEAEVAFRTMMEVRTKLVSAYQEVMRMGSGG